ncbi:IclR family transcriptional regulator [Billgrantia ethanolica]|uniref:HTH-type transcriptional repressor AllR n=1 Tax=Billgrantia ethanolica TaxID=2733486 RepID=A0ABS9AA92_9GAMM|nr:helix-turn-helix domain-containing protein [Halomonas ethanolica]MCE8004749.1 helix-turn-helix domain-containing protein [Halomonas ethanolica]
MATTLQTLDRGLRALEIVAEHAEGISIAELAERLDVHRAIAYRIVTTLEQHGLVARSAEGPLRLGAGISLLAARFEPQLRAVAQPLLQALAKATRATAFVSVAQGEECVVILVAEPDEGLLRVGYRVGSRHPLSLGAAGIAILAGRPPRADDSEAVRQARSDGYSLTRGQLQLGAVGVASPVATPQFRPGVEACVGVVAMDDLDTERAIREVKAHAHQLAELLGR